MAEELNEQKMPDKEPIGRASATVREANSSEKFSFWLRPEKQANPFDIVAAEHLNGSKTYGLITNIHHYTDSASHLSNFISNDFGSLLEEPNTPRQGTNVADVSVLSNDQDNYMPVQNEALIYFADEEGIHRALGIDQMKEKEEREGRPIRIPAGLIQLSNGTEAVAYLDADYVLGPESAHVNISGISGLATKTSYIMFLIQSILQTVESENIATILLNVKHGDLLHIDEMIEGGLDPEQHRMWDRLGVEPKVFEREKVHYLLPWGKDSATTGRPNSFGEPPEHFKMYAYAFRETVDKLDLLFSTIPDPYETLSSLIGEIQKGIGDNESKWRDIHTWTDLMTKKPLVDNGIPQKYGNIAQSSVGRFIRYLRRIVKNRQSGVFVEQRARNAYKLSEEIGNIQGGHVYVVDIAKLKDEEQTLVFGDIIRTVYELYAESDQFSEDEIPEKVIIFVDELNKYAPSRGQTSPIVQDILDIAERGRSLGVILMSAQQFMSAVHPRVTGNSATKLIGRTDSAELSESNYRFLNQEIKMHLTRLEKGELLLNHPIYRQPVKIKFPKPVYKQTR